MERRITFKSCAAKTVTVCGPILFFIVQSVNGALVSSGIIIHNALYCENSKESRRLTRPCARILAYHPSCNTDQGVYQMCECDGDKPEREMKVIPVNVSSSGLSRATGLGPDLL